MKKLNKLFATLIAVLSVQTLSAQTDVTSTYLTNAGFDDNNSWITADVAQLTTKAAEGWTATSSGDTWWYGGTVNYGSSFKVNSVTPPATNPDGKAEGGALGISAGWGCTVTYKQEVKLPAGVYTLSYKAYNANTGATQANNYIGFTSSSVTVYGKTTNFTANTWVEESVTFALTTETTGSISVGMGAVSGGSGANAKLFIDGVTLSYKTFDDVSENNPVDLSSMVSNTQSAWIGATEFPKYIDLNMPAVWKSSHFTGDALSQTVSNLPIGKYEMTAFCHAHSSWVTAVASAGDDTRTILKANDVSVGIPISLNGGADSEKDQYTLKDIKITNGTLSIKVTNEQQGANWISVYVSSLQYLGPDLTLYIEALKSNLKEAEQIDPETIPSSIAKQLESAISSAENVEENLKAIQAATDKLIEAIRHANEIKPSYALLNNLITLCASYAEKDYSVVKDENTRSTFTTAISAAIDEKGKATTADELTQMYNTLEKARQVYVETAYPAIGKSFDMTYKIIDSEITSKNGWTTNANIANNVEYEGAPDIYAFDLWHWAAKDVYAHQTIKNLPGGVYTLTAMARTSGADMCYVYATNNGIEYKKVVVGGGNTGNPWGLVTVSDIAVFKDTSMELGLKGMISNTWFSVDNFKLYRAYDTTEAQKNLKALIKEAETLAVSKPMSADQASTLQSTISNINTDITNILELEAMHDNLSGAIANAKKWVEDYNSAKAPLVAVLERFETDYNEGTNGCTLYKKEKFWSTVIEEVKDATRAKDVTDSYYGFATATSELKAALDALQASVDLYANLKAEIGFAQAYMLLVSDNIDEHSAAINQAQQIYNAKETEDASEAIYAMQRYRELDAEYIAHNYNKEIILGEWTGKTNTNKGEHWSGDANTTYYDYSIWSGAATYEATQTIKLPAGEYVLKAAGRSSIAQGTEAYIKVNDQKVNFCAKGNNGAGIDTDGNVNFSTSKSYANGTGRGWEYRFIEFKLDKETEVTLTAGMTISDSWEPLAWAGICTPILLTPNLDIAYEELQATIDASQPIWHGLDTEYENSILPYFQTACTNKKYSYVSEIKAAIEDIKNAFIEYVRNTANNIDRRLNYTELIGDATCEKNDSWPGSGRSTLTGEHWSGDTKRVYFAQNHQSGAARAQTITLPYKGCYLLKVAVRAVANNSYAEILVDGRSHRFPGAHGRTGGSIATDGTEWESIEAGLEAGKTFANNNAGYGWVYKYIYFTTATANATTTIAINLSDKDTKKAEANCGGMELYFIGKNCEVIENDEVIHYGEYTDIIVATHTTHNVTNSTISNLSVDVTANPNTLIIANKGQVSNTCNTIVGNTATSFVLTDGYAFHATADFTAKSLSYNRELSDNWLTVCLPFEYTIPEGVKVETLSEIDTETKTFTFEAISGTMKANTPYIIKNSSDAAPLFASLSEVEVKATPKAMTKEVAVEGSEHKAEFIGTYTTVKTDALMEDGAYDILFFGTKGQLYYLSQGVTEKVVNIKPFRAYIRLPKGAINWSDGQQARVRHRNSEITDIDTLESADDSQKTTVIYDMHGRRVTEMVKGGMYIVNGKKVIVK